MKNSELVRYMISSGLLSEADISIGKFRMIPDGNERFGLITVECAGKKVYFVKKALNEDGFYYLRREIICRQYLSDSGVLVANLPRLCASDVTTGILITECIDPCVSLNEAVLAHPELVTQAACESANILSQFNYLPAPKMIPELEGKLPWIFGIFKRPPTWRPPTFHKVLPLIKNHSRLKTVLGSAALLWSHSYLIHGDIKWDNFLLMHVDESMKNMRLIDWELAGIGDPGWDLAGVLNELLMTEAYSQGKTARDYRDEAHLYVLFETVREAAIGIKDTYTQGGMNHFNRQFAEKLILFTAVRLLQSAFEMAVVETVTQSEIAFPIQIAEYVLTYPSISDVLFS